MTHLPNDLIFESDVQNLSRVATELLYYCRKNNIAIHDGVTDHLERLADACDAVDLWVEAWLNDERV